MYLLRAKLTTSGSRGEARGPVNTKGAKSADLWSDGGEAQGQVSSQR